MTQYHIDRSMWNWQNIVGCILPNWVNISPHSNFVAISLYGGFFFEDWCNEIKRRLLLYTFLLSKYIAKYIYQKFLLSFTWNAVFQLCKYLPLWRFLFKHWYYEMYSFLLSKNKATYIYISFLHCGLFEFRM